MENPDASMITLQPATFYIQGDHSPWRKPPVDIDMKVAF